MTGRALDQTPTYMSCATLARHLDVCESTVSAMVQRGVIPKPIKFSPGCVRFCWADVQSALSSLASPAGANDDDDPFMKGLRNVTVQRARGRTP